MAKIYDFHVEYKHRLRRAKMLDILETAVLMVKRNELDGLAVFGRQPKQDSAPAYPFARENFPHEELLDIAIKAKEKGL